MEILKYILLSCIAWASTKMLSETLGEFVSSKVRVCNIDFMNKYYFEINFDFIIGGLLYSAILIHALDRPIWVGIVLGYAINSIHLVFGRMKNYETLRKNLPLLDIDDNESFEKFVETTIEKDEDE